MTIERRLILRTVRILRKQFKSTLFRKVFISKGDREKFENGDSIGGVVRLLNPNTQNNIGISLRKVDFQYLNNNGICVIKRI